MKNGLGWFTGVGIAILLLVVGNVLYTCTRNNGKKYAQQYIDNSVNVQLDIPDGEVDWEPKSITTGIVMTTRKAIGCYRSIFYEKKHKKYFCVFVLEPRKKYGVTQAQTVHGDICDRPFILARINKYELNSPKYGTKDNPIPILNFDYRLSMYSIYTHEKLKSDIKYPFSTPAYYQQAVEKYLTYVMSKEEFKERFR